MRRANAALVAVVLAGSLAGPAAAQARGGAQAPGEAGQRVLGLFGDTTLARLVNEAMEANPDLAAVEARIGGARAERMEAALDLAPAVTATGGFTRQKISGISFPGSEGSLRDQSLWAAGVQMSWEVDAFGRGRRSLDARSSLLDAAEEDVRDERVLLAAEVAAAYYALAGAQDRLGVARRNAENQRRTLGVTQDRLDGGRGTALDTERARAQLSSTLAAIPGLEGAVEVERQRLATLLGRSPEGLPDDLGRVTGALPESVEPVDVDAVVEQRPDVQAAERRAAAGEALVGSAKAGYLPRIAIQGSMGYTAGALHALGNSGTARYAVGPVLSWPLLDLGRVKSNVDAAQASRGEARARYEGAVLRAREEVASSLVSYRAARERLDHLQDAADASGRAAELARLRFQEGAGDFLEVLDSERRLLEAEERLSAGRTEAAVALAGVYRATGGWEVRAG